MVSTGLLTSVLVILSIVLLEVKCYSPVNATFKMSKVKLNIIAAACENMGIGVNGTLPWRLKNEMAYFTSMTKKVIDSSKKNAVIMGRVSWDSIPDKYRPLPGRVNIVLTRHVNDLQKRVPGDVVVVPGLDEAIQYVDSREDIENVWVIGGSAIYKLAMEHSNCNKIYLTKIKKQYDCDTFFPAIDYDKYHIVREDGVPEDKQVEGDVEYYYIVYQKV